MSKKKTRRRKGGTQCPPQGEEKNKRGWKPVDCNSSGSIQKCCPPNSKCVFLDLDEGSKRKVVCAYDRGKKRGILMKVNDPGFIKWLKEMNKDISTVGETRGGRKKKKRRKTRRRRQLKRRKTRKKRGGNDCKSCWVQLRKCKKKLKRKNNPSTPTKHREIWSEEFGTPGALGDPNWRAAENETFKYFGSPRSTTPRSTTPRSARALFKGGKRKQSRRKRGGKNLW